MAPEAVDCGVPSGTRLFSPDVPASRAAAASSDRDPRHTGSTGIRGTCVNGPPTALAAVVPFGPVETSACGPSMGRRTGDARTPCRARPRPLPSWRRGPPRADSHACTHRVQGDHFYEGLDGAAVRTLAAARGDAQPTRCLARHLSVSQRATPFDSPAPGGRHVPNRSAHRRSRHPAAAAAAVHARAGADPAPVQLAARRQGQEHRPSHRAGARPALCVGVPVPAAQPRQGLQARPTLVQRSPCRLRVGALVRRSQGRPSGAGHDPDLLLAPQDLHPLDRQAQAAQAHPGLLRRPRAVPTQRHHDERQVVACAGHRRRVGDPRCRGLRRARGGKPLVDARLRTAVQGEPDAASARRRGDRVPSQR